MKCRDCKYIGMEERKRGEYKVPVCRRYAPRILHGSGAGWSNDAFPEVRPEDDWCGEFELAEKETQQEADE